MNQLPEAYIKQMKRLLGEAGFFAYEKALGEPVTRALRINLLLRPDGNVKQFPQNDRCNDERKTDYQTQQRILF